MTLGAAQEAAIEYIESLNLVDQVVAPNRSAEAKTPRIEVFQGPVISERATLRGATDSEPLIQIDVVVDADDGTGRQGEIVDQLYAAFGSAIRFGPAHTAAAPQVSGYRQDGGEYRASITVRYRTYTPA